MLVKQLRKLGINSDAMQLMGLASIFGSILTWRAAKKTGDPQHGERLAIFVDLWAPTFFVLASQQVSVETAEAIEPGSQGTTVHGVSKTA